MYVEKTVYMHKIKEIYLMASKCASVHAILAVYNLRRAVCVCVCVCVCG